MTPAANSADSLGPEFAPLLTRLCDLAADVVYFPVRHHSPACAALIQTCLEQLRPAAVLIEGPSDFNDRIAELYLDHELPIAIYSYFRAAGVPRGAYYPFCEYSPEWSALRTARNIGAHTEFIDLPWTETAQLDDASHRYGDAEFRRSRYIQLLCERFHVEDFDDLWDKLIETQTPLSLADLLTRVHALCFQMRLWEQEIGLADRRREAFMAARIERRRAAVTGQIVVITGGFHSSALAARLDSRFHCPGTTDHPLSPAADPVVLDDVGISLTGYSYERLDSLTGYNAGMPSPGFYHHVWQEQQSGRDYSHHPLLVQLVAELRRRKQTLSTADLIAVETSARTLAALRGRGQVWRRDLVDAVTSALIKDELEYGCGSPFIAAVEAVLRGNRRGRLAEGTVLPPLVLEIRRRLQAESLEPAARVATTEFDLLTAEGLGRSKLLHGIQVLGIAGFIRTGGTDFLERSDLTRLWETWKLHWSPEFDATCIEAARYGTTIPEAVSARLTELARSHERDAGAAAKILVQAAQAGVDTISESLLDSLQNLVAQEANFTSAATALEHLLFLFSFDEAFGTQRLPRLARMLNEAFARSIWLLETLGRANADEKLTLRGMQALLETFQRTRGQASIELDASEFQAVLQRVESDSGKSPAVRGAAAGMLWTLAAADEERILSNLRLFSAPEELGDFLAGLFALAREVVQRQPRLIQAIDRLLLEFGADDFHRSLPALRLAFTYFTPREKHHLLSTLFESLGLKAARPLAALQVDDATAAQALALETRVFELLAKYGLENDDD